MSDRRSLGAREFEILVVLVAGPRHGYAIMQELREHGGGDNVLGPGTLYRVLKDLVKRGLITVVTSRPEETDGPPRRVYRLTAQGQRITTGEARRLAGLLERARPLLEPDAR